MWSIHFLLSHSDEVSFLVNEKNLFCERKLILSSFYLYTVTGLLGSGIAGLALQWITEPLVIVVFFCTHIMLAGICVSVTNGAVVDLIPTHLRYLYI